jgi:4-amino-4-deoxy-L-arabinose transferase-like glycosyltransferase
MNALPSSRRGALALLAVLAILVAALAINARFRTPDVHGGDTPEYLLMAHNMAVHGVASKEVEAPPAPRLGREPAYPALLALLMRQGLILRGFTPDCVLAAGRCPDAMFRSAQWLNVWLGLAAAVFTGLAAWTWLSSGCAGLVAFGYVALNAQAFRMRHWLISDYLALLLVALMLWLLARAWQVPARLGRWAAAGLALAALILTKAVFLYLLLLFALAGLVLALRHRAVRAPLLLFVTTAGLPVLLWMLRNHVLAGEFALTDARSGIALSTREVFNHMGLTENLAAFVFWTRGMGDGLARQLFAPEIWQPFQIDWPGGYYDVGQHRYRPWVAEVQRTHGLSEAAARAVVDRALIAAFLERPLGYIASMPALFYRGIWVDEFIVLGLPALAWALWRGLRARDAVALTLLVPALFNLVFYASISLNIPRYQLTALPGIALATAALALHLAPWAQARWARLRATGRN